MEEVSNHLIHETDLSFQQYIYEEFGVNRGVYNTIEQWFYEQGCMHVLHRRKEIINFLHDVSNSIKRSKKKLEFGSGRLVLYLEKYVMSKGQENLDWDIQSKTG